MTDVRKLRERAASYTARGKWGKAADALSELVRADPRDLSARQKLAEALRKKGDDAGAVKVYRELADRFAEAGHLLKAVAVCKLILEIDPAHTSAQTALADLYARRRAEQRPSLDAASEPAGATGGLALGVEPEDTLVLEPLAAPVSGDEPSPPAPRTPYEVIMGAAREGAAREAESAAPPPGQDGQDDPFAASERRRERAPADPADSAADLGASHLPFIPLFSDLSHDAFVQLLRRLALRRASPGDVILQEGDPGTSFFVIAAGQVRVEKAAPGGALHLAHLGEGAFFGEMALLSGAQRLASVVAESSCDLLEITTEVLEGLCRAHPHVGASLTRFYRQRLIANSLATTALFRPFDQADRRALLSRFVTRIAQPGEALVQQGKPADGLYVVLSGEVDVVKDGHVLVARLGEGELFGEMSCLSKGPATADVVARRRTMLLRLPRAAFDEVVVAYPPVLELLAEMSAVRQRQLALLLSTPPVLQRVRPTGT